MSQSARITAASAWSCVLGSALLVASTAHANLRAPLVDAHDGSSALYPAPGVEVEREELDFDCAQTACEVSATYTLRAQEAQTLSLSFILPSPAKLRVQLGTADVAMQEIRSEPVDEKERASLSPLSRSSAPTLHKASFEVTLKPGANPLRIRYRQHCDGEERGHSYFSKGRFVYQLRYEVWPLKAWRRAPGFRLTLRATYRRTHAPGWWQRVFGDVATLICRDEARTRLSPELPRATHQISFTRAFEATQLPDRLLCDMGPEELVRTPR